MCGCSDLLQKFQSPALSMATSVLETDGMELTSTNLPNLSPDDESIYCQSVFLDLEIFQIYQLIEYDEEEVNSIVGKFQFRIKDSTSAYLRVSGLHGVINLTLDVQAHITADSIPSLTEDEQLEENNQSNHNIYRSYIYTRFAERYRLNILHYGQNFDEILENEYATFDFFLQQFCRYYDYKTTIPHFEGHSASTEHKRQVNVVARGVESTGFLLRQGLKESGKTAGDVIRYFAQTSHSTKEADSQHETSSLLVSESRKQLTEEEIAAEEKKAEYYKKQAETIHSYAKTATSAIMLPIRMIGRKAVELAQPNAEEEQGWKRALMDTVGGCGNGIMSVAKGFTEVFN